MKKYYQYLGLVAIMFFSFYYTEHIAGVVLNKNPLMQTIQKESENYRVECVNAIIYGDYITPGINGLEVNARESFYKMKQEDVFNQYFLVYDQVKPDLSLENNKDKIIQKGNSKLKKVSFVFELENEITDYFKEHSLKGSLLIYLNNYKKGNYFEVINNEVKGFQSLENSLNMNKENQHICILNEQNKEICKKNQNYLVDPLLKLNSSNLVSVKKNLSSGSIIFISKDAKLTDVVYLLKEIQYKDYEIVTLKEMINENR